MTKKKRTKLKQKTRIQKKEAIRMIPGKQDRANTNMSKKAVNEKHAFIQGVASAMSKVRDDMGDKILEQAVEIKRQDGQLQSGSEKQIRSDEHIDILTKAMESTNEGIFIIDARKPEFPIIYINKAFQAMTGRAKSKILGHNYFLLYGPDSGLRIGDDAKQTLSRAKPYNGEALCFKKNGKKRWNILRISPIQDAQGIVTHYVGIQTDITMMREQEREIDEKREELLHVTRVGKLAEFVSSLAHEISQPLTAILSYAQAASRMLADREPEIQKILEYIVSDDHRATDVIQRLRSLLKKGTPEMKTLSINDVINETVRLIATDANVRHAVIKTELEDDLPSVSGDRVQLQQVLLNLISNSFDAMESSQDPREILIRTSRKDAGTIMAEVKDSGCGIPEENLTKLFTRFFTSKPDGLGMGLSISRSIIEAHGGQLEVRNNPDRGVTFDFTIPVDTKDA